MTKKTKLVILIPVGAAILNGLGYLVAINLRTPAKVAPAAADVVEGSGRAPVASASTGPALRDRPSERSTADREREERALARRAAGVAALEAGDYTRAVAAFAEARSIAGDKAYVGELMRVAEDLAHRQPAARRLPPPHTASAPPVGRPALRTRVAERAVAAPESLPPSAPPGEGPPPPAPATPAATSGLLLVTTTPRGLLVQVDDVPVDLTPTRASLKVGPHHVALLDGERKVYETNVEVKAGAPTTLLRDLSAVVAPPAPARAAPPSLAKEDAPAPEAPAAEAPRPIPSPQAALLAPPAATPAVRTGALQITSPGLYGEVWINGRPRGFPPLLAEDLPPGPTRVDVRVNGIEERSATVAVRPGMTTPVKLTH